MPDRLPDNAPDNAPDNVNPETDGEMLIQKFLEGTLDQAGAVQLFEMMRQHPDIDAPLNRKLTDQLWLHHLLNFQSNAIKLDFLDAQASTAPVVDERENAKPRQTPPDDPFGFGVPASRTSSEHRHETITQEPQSQRNVPSLSRKARANARWDRILLLVGVSCLCLCVGVLLEFGTSRQSRAAFQPLARITASVETVWPENAFAFKTGQELEAERIRFDKGMLELTLSRGERIVLEGPVDFQINSPQRTFCRYGTISAFVPPEGKGFEIATPLLTVIDRGTEFHLHVQDEKVATHTITGLVELDRLPHDKEALTAGNAFEIASDGGIVRKKNDASLFVTKSRVEHHVSLADHKERTRWTESLERFQRDPAFLVHFDFGSDSERNAKTVENRTTAGKSSIPNAFPTGTQWTPGRWKGTGALRFTGKHDAVAFSCPRPLTDMTALASVRIDRLERHSQVLLASRNTGAGHIIWQLTREGTMQFSIQKDAEMSAAKFTTGCVFPRKTWGAWYTLAVVVDGGGKTVTFYVDGLSVQKASMSENTAIQIKDATLGNGFWEGNARTDRSFHGAMEQFLLFGKALSEQEIRTLSL